jgi:hypothetical protein
MRRSIRPRPRCNASDDVGAEDCEAYRDVLWPFALDRLNWVLGCELAKFGALDSGIQPAPEPPSCHVTDEVKLLPVAK